MPAKKPRQAARPRLPAAAGGSPGSFWGPGPKGAAAAAGPGFEVEPLRGPELPPIKEKNTVQNGPGLWLFLFFSDF